MSDQTAILAALVTKIDATLGEIGTTPKGADALTTGEGAVWPLDYTVDVLPWRQESILYPFVLLYKDTDRGSGIPAARNSLYDDLEAIRLAIRSDDTLGGVVKDARVTGILVSSDGQEILGQMDFEARVLE